MANPESITVEVVYAERDGAVVVPVTLAATGATVQQAVERSGVLERNPGIDLARNKVGIYGKVCKLDHEVRDGDRIEIYRPLVADPKTVRKKKAPAGSE